MPAKAIQFWVFRVSRTAFASLASSKDNAHLTFVEISFACVEVKYIRVFLLSLRCELINDREVKSRPIDIPAVKAIITNFLLELSVIYFLFTR